MGCGGGGGVGEVRLKQYDQNGDAIFSFCPALRFFHFVFSFFIRDANSINWVKCHKMSEKLLQANALAFSL